MPQTTVRTYGSQTEFQRDANRMGAEGWRVTSTMDQQQRSGCMRMMTLGLFALVWKPKAKIVVTYTRD